MADPVEIDLPLVANGNRPLTHNQRYNHYRRNQLVQQIRKDAGWSAKALMRQHKIGQQRHITVQLHYRPGDTRRRDAPNLTATSKPAIDGLVDAGLVKDDADSYVTEIMPAIHPEPGPRRLWLAIHIPEENGA